MMNHNFPQDYTKLKEPLRRYKSTPSGGSRAAGMASRLKRPIGSVRRSSTLSRASAWACIRAMQAFGLGDGGQAIRNLRLLDREVKIEAHGLACVLVIAHQIHPNGVPLAGSVTRADLSLSEWPT